MITCAESWTGLMDECERSDNCRITNWTTPMVRGERKRYEYPRYFFTNVSDDIRQLSTDTLDSLGRRVDALHP